MNGVLVKFLATSNLLQNKVFKRFHLSQRKHPDEQTQTCSLSIGLHETDSHLVEFISNEINAEKIDFGLIGLKNVAKQASKIFCFKQIATEKNNFDNEYVEIHSSIPRNQLTELDEQSTKNKPMECIICYDRLKNIIFLPCAHLSCCFQCSASVADCPICRTKIEASIRTYF